MYEEVAGDSYYRYIALANQLAPRWLTLEAINEMIGYWKKFNKKIIFFTGTPRFPNHYKYQLLGLEPRIDLQTETLKLTHDVRAALEANSVSVVDRNQVFCAINNCSYFSKDGQPLISDERGEHLSLAGADLFGAELVKMDVFLRVVNLEQ